MPCAHHRRAIVELYQCTKFRVTPPKFPEVKKRCLLPMCIVHNVHSALAMHVHYATHHKMQCTIELRTLSFISVPNLVSLAQNFLESEDPARIKFFGPGECTLHPTRTVTGKACRLGQYTCDLQDWDRRCTSSCLQWRQKKKMCKTLARVLHVHSALQPIKSYGAKYLHYAKVYPPTEFGVSGSKFPCIGGPPVKKVSRPCRVQPAPHRLGLSTLKIWCECPASFSRQTPESSTDRQREGGGGREGRQKMLTYPPSINIRNTKNLHMLKHMNFPLSSYDFG